MTEPTKNNLSKKNYSFFYDFKWYLLGSFIPLLIGFIKTPIFTSHFTQNDFGKLGLIQITFSFFVVFLFSWVSTCIWRYYEYHNKNNSLNTLFSNIVFIYLMAIIVVILISVVWIFISKDIVIKQLITYSLISLIFSQFFIYYMIFVRLKGKANYYNTLNSLKIVTSFIVALLLVFVFNLSIVSLALNLALIDFLFFIYLIIKNPLKLNFSINKITKKLLTKLLTYGGAGLILNFGYLAIMSSDRFVLANYSSIDDVGLYDQIYKLSHLLGYTIFVVFLNTINPTLNKILENNFKKSEIIIEKYINLLLIFGLPIITYLSLTSKDIAFLLLGEKFRIGYTIMPYIFISSFFYIIINFFEMRLKFSNKLKKLIFFILLTTIVNLTLTFVLVPTYNIEGASFATLFSYCFLFFIFYFNDSKLYTLNKKNGYLIAKILIILIFQIFIFLFIQKQYNVNIFINFIIVLLFFLSYLFLFKKTILKIDVPMMNKSETNK